MVDILTDKGVFLDMDPEAEFEITMDNPLLNDDRIPVPFSTGISFLATPTNKAVFGYVDAMMLVPSVRKLAATILIGGIPFLYGMLVFDEIGDDGKINYTFSGQGLEEEWSNKLWELDLSVNPYYPLIINENYVAEPGYIFTPSPTSLSPGVSVLISAKYINYYGENVTLNGEKPIRVPAIPIMDILRRTIVRVSDSSLSKILENFVIFGTYVDGSGDAVKALPDITLSEFIRGLCNMFCLFFFPDGSGYRWLSAKEALASDSVIDWDANVSDKFRSSYESSEEHSFGTGTGEYHEDDVSEADRLISVFRKAGEKYEVVKHTPSGAIFSCRINEVPWTDWFDWSGFPHVPTGQERGRIRELLIDRIGANKNRNDSSAFSVPRCVPAGWEKIPADAEYGPAEHLHRMVPVLPVVANAADRPTDVYVALDWNNQVSDTGYVFFTPDDPFSLDLKIGADLNMGVFLERNNKAFAAWLAKDRQTLSVDLNLSVVELASFRMWQTVRVRGRNFLVSKLSIRCSASSAGVDVSADLISL